MLLVWILLLIALLWIFSPPKQNPFIKLIHPYSGLAPDVWKRFMAHANAGQNREAAEAVRELAMWSDEHADHINEIADKVYNHQ